MPEQFSSEASFYQLLRQTIRKQMNEYADDVATGSAPDFPSYQRHVGKIEGLALAEAIIIDIEKKILADEQDDI